LGGCEVGKGEWEREGLDGREGGRVCAGVVVELNVVHFWGNGKLEREKGAEEKEGGGKGSCGCSYGFLCRVLCMLGRMGSWKGRGR
jgi:hypothetical protein